MNWMLYLQALLGLAAFIALTLPFSTNRRGIRWPLVAGAVVLQFAICILLLKVPVISDGFAVVNQAVGALGDATRMGTTFVYGFLGGGEKPFAVTNPNVVVIFAFQVLPLVIVMSALSAVLWYWRILPAVVRGISAVFERVLGTRGPAGLGATANLFMGQVEAPLLVRPYLATMTRYELLILMTAGMATIAGSVMVIYAAMLGEQFRDILTHLLIKSIMSVPASILFAHLLIPDTTSSELEGGKAPRIYDGTMDAISRGTADGLGIYLNILAILIVLIAFVALVNGAVGLLPAVGGETLSLERVAGWLFAPLAWLMGIPWSEASVAGSLLGVKTVMNEFIAYMNLADLPAGELSERSRLITMYALCGFANFASIGIQISGIGAMAPERRGDLADLALRALLAATLASCMTGAIVGIVAY